MERQGRKLMTHFVAANLIDATLTVFGTAAFGNHLETGVLGDHLRATQGIEALLAAKLMVIAFLVSTYALEKNGYLKKLSNASEKAMMATVPILYSVCAINLLTVATELLNRLP